MYGFKYVDDVFPSEESGRLLAFLDKSTHAVALFKMDFTPQKHEMPLQVGIGLKPYTAHTKEKLDGMNFLSFSQRRKER